MQYFTFILQLTFFQIKNLSMVKMKKKPVNHNNHNSNPADNFELQDSYRGISDSYFPSARVFNISLFCSL